jgi:hypothetical protein
MSAAPETTDVVRPLYRVAYDALVEQGFLVDEPVELIEGRLLARSRRVTGTRPSFAAWHGWCSLRSLLMRATSASAIRSR